MSAQSRKHIVFCPQWYPQAQFAGYIVAYNLGFYSDEGLDVEIRYPNLTMSSLNLLLAGKADFITTMLSDAVKNNASNEKKLVNVLQTSQHGSLCIVKKPGDTKVEPHSFDKLRVGLWYSGMTSPAEAMNNVLHLNWKIIRFRDGFNMMNYDMVDAISAMDYNELLHMKYSGWDVSDRAVLRLYEHGYDIPEDGVYCESSFYQENKETVHAFVRATKKGWEWCREHPKEAIDYVINEMRNHYIYSSKVIQMASLKVILERQELTAGNIPYKLNAKQFQHAVEMMKAAHLLDTDLDYENFIAK